VGTISQDYRGVTVHEIPPNGQGIVCLMALGILSNFDVADYPVDSADSVHLQIEAVKLAFADARRYVADPKAMGVRAGAAPRPGLPQVTRQADRHEARPGLRPRRASPRAAPST